MVAPAKLAEKQTSGRFESEPKKKKFVIYNSGRRLIYVEMGRFCIFSGLGRA
jgi:hypothetical protein